MPKPKGTLQSFTQTFRLNHQKFTVDIDEQGIVTIGGDFVRVRVSSPIRPKQHPPGGVFFPINGNCPDDEELRIDIYRLDGNFEAMVAEVSASRYWPPSSNPRLIIDNAEVCYGDGQHQKYVLRARVTDQTTPNQPSPRLRTIKEVTLPERPHRKKRV